MLLGVSLFVFCCFSVNEITAQDNISGYGNECVYFLDEYNKPHYVNFSDCHLWLVNRNNLLLPIPSVKFWLYTRNNINVEEELFIELNQHQRSDIFSFSTNYMPDKPVVVVTHGWISNGTGPSTQTIKNALLLKYNYNIIIVDWGAVSNELYIIAALQTSAIAEKITELLLMLAKKYGLQGTMVHMIGHSLGAHIVSLAAKSLSEHNLKPARVTGLDPARPFFEFPPMLPGISPDGASFVDIIHTDSGIFGIRRPRGHADFYPNGGYWQPNCGLLGDACRHSASYVYFVESIFFNIYKSRQCSSFLWYLLNLCALNDIQYMGYPCQSNARGTYYLVTY